MPLPPPILAAGEWIIQLIVIFVFLFGGWIIRMLGQVGQQLAENKKAQQGPPPLDEEDKQAMEEFFRRSAEQPAADDLAEDTREASSPLPPRPRRLSATGVEEPMEAELVLVDDVDDSVAESVAALLDTGDFNERASHMAERIGQTDERLELRLHTKFDHEIGRLGDSSDSIHEQPDQPAPSGKRTLSAGELRHALTHRDSVRQAIIINEILHRPESRWD